MEETQMRHLMLRGAAVCAALALGLAGPIAGAAETAAKKDAPLVGVVNVNTASAEQLALLPGVGPARASAIIAHRTKNGAFKKPEDLIAVSGIGERAFERLRPYVAVSGETTAEPAP
jgi:competence protein ComEA